MLSTFSRRKKLQKVQITIANIFRIYIKCNIKHRFELNAVFLLLWATPPALPSVVKEVWGLPYGYASQLGLVPENNKT